MTHLNDDTDLQSLWQKTPPVDVDKLLKSVVKAQKDMRRLFYYELAGSVFGLIFLVWAYLHEAFGKNQWMLVTLGVIAVAFQIWTWSWRRGLWNAIADSPRQLLQVRRKHLLLDIKIAQSCYWGIAVGGVLGVIAGYFDVSESRLDISVLTRTSIFVALIMITAGFLVWSIRKEKKARKKLKTLDEKIKEYESEENL